MSNYFRFTTNANATKPRTIKKDANNPPCPFCDYEVLAKRQEVLKDMDQSLLTINLFPAIQQTYQTVFIETKDCDANFLTYDKETCVMVTRNFFESYQFLKEKHPNKQIVGVKNAGEFSAGSIHHQHMQLVVLEQFLKPISPAIFEGVSVYENESIAINFSEKPMTEFYEINLSIAKEDLFAYGELFETFALCLQTCIRFTLSTLTKRDSYNLAFYFDGDNIHIKLLPRNLNSPFLLLLDMHFVPDNLDDYRTLLAEEIKKAL